MLAILTLLVTLTTTLLITRIATVALMLTGLSRESARFQARSALSGVGFTTNEAESVVNHPVRRQVIMLLMLLGNVGIVTFAATLMVSFLGVTASPEWPMKIGVLALGLFCIYLFAASRWVDRRLSVIITRALRRWTTLDVADYVALLQLSRGYAVTELKVQPDGWLADRTLARLALPKEGILVLGVERVGGGYVATPIGSTEIRPHDTLVLYGPLHRLAELDSRESGAEGQTAHEAACEDQSREVRQQQREEALEAQRQSEKETEEQETPVDKHQITNKVQGSIRQ